MISVLRGDNHDRVVTGGMKAFDIKQELVRCLGRPRLIKVFLAIGPVLLNVLAAGAIWVIVDERHQAWDRAALEAANLTSLVERETARSIDVFDLSLQS